VVLGVGEASTLLSFYLASKGATVYTVDLGSLLVANANQVARVMGWKLFNLLAMQPTCPSRQQPLTMYFLSVFWNTSKGRNRPFKR